MCKRFLFLFLCILLISACVPAAQSQLVIEEHLLTAPPDLSTDQLVFHFASGNQDQILAKTAPYRDFRKQYEDYNRQALAPFGYSLKDQAEPAGAGYMSIYHGDQLVAKDVMFIPPVSVNASKTDFVGMADLSDGTYLFTHNQFRVSDWSTGRQLYGYVGNRLLSVERTNLSPGVADLRVSLDNQLAYETQYNDVSTYEFFDGPWTYGNHWALVLLDAKPGTAHGPAEYDRLILDGQDINSAKGYEQSFQFALLDGRPFYFYQKSGKIGISFDGQEFAKDYDEIPHYQCCIPALLNPGKSLNMVWFFARRGNDWYYVEAYVPGQP
jgi:hypothetical protein